MRNEKKINKLKKNILSVTSIKKKLIERENKLIFQHP